MKMRPALYDDNAYAYNCAVVRISCRHAFGFLFCGGAVAGGLLGLALALLSGSAVGISGGLFVGFLIALMCGLAGAIFAAVFNVLAPAAGGLGVRIEPLPAPLQAPGAADAKDAAGAAALAAAPSGASGQNCEDKSAGPYQNV